MKNYNYQEKNREIQPISKEKAFLIFKVTLILFVVTVIEFIIAFVMDAGTVRTGIFLVLTILKAFYIVAEFMHLGHEKKTLVYAILLPFIFIVWLIIALLYQGADILNTLGI
ncbi:MAG: cytochrome C oxidase subunit IV family protein [Chitinophagaceae bacterium]|nr:cytochrome C oxidase subunit IV family protein [Chitinophagaceae bacterium]